MAPGPSARPTVWSSISPSSVISARQRSRKRAVVRRPDMLEHADADDPVEPPLDLAPVAQLEPHPALEPLRRGAGAGMAQLLFRQGDSEHLDVRGPGEMEGEPAPAAADVEHLLARGEAQLGGDMGHLRGLGGVEVPARRAVK